MVCCNSMIYTKPCSVSLFLSGHKAVCLFEARTVLLRYARTRRLELCRRCAAQVSHCLRHQRFVRVCPVLLLVGLAQDRHQLVHGGLVVLRKHALSLMQDHLSHELVLELSLLRVVGDGQKAEPRADKLLVHRHVRLHHELLLVLEDLSEAGDSVVPCVVELDLFR